MLKRWKSIKRIKQKKGYSMRRQFNPKLREYLKTNATKYTIDELLPKVNKKFNETYTRLQLQKYLYRNKIKYKYTNPSKIRDMSKVCGMPIGSEYTKPDGMVMKKISKNKWVYKQRYIYEQYHRVKLKEDEYIIFLNQNRNDFSIDNLALVSRKVSGYMTNHNLFNKRSEITKLNILYAKIMCGELEV